MRLQPSHRGLDPGVVRGKAGIDHALQAGVGHGGVAAQATVFRFASRAAPATGRRVIETAVRILCAELRGVVF